MAQILLDNDLTFLNLQNPSLTSVYLFGVLNFVKLIFYLINTQKYIESNIFIIVYIITYVNYNISKK